jgi:hypothetical protein
VNDLPATNMLELISISLKKDASYELISHIRNSTCHSWLFDWINPDGLPGRKWIKGIDLRQYGSGTVSGSMCVGNMLPIGQLFLLGCLIFSKGLFPVGWE